MAPNKRDTVRVWKSVMGREYSAQGPVKQLRYDHGRYLMRVAGDWWMVANDAGNRYEIVQPDDARCRHCDEVGVEMTPVNIAVNYDENGEEDPGGCFTRHHTEWQCADSQACQERRREWAQLAQETARWADMEAREQGAFAIGGGVG